MMRRDLLAYGLIGLGVLALLARVSGGAGWLWIALVAAALLAVYVSQRTYGLLVVGAVLAGTSVGLLLQQLFPRCDGVFLIALGLGVATIDVVEPREPRWRWRFGLGLAALGLLLSLANSGVLGSVWFAVLLIVIGGALLWRGRETQAFPPPVVEVPVTRPAARPPAAAEGPADGGTPPERAAGDAGSVDTTTTEATTADEAADEDPDSATDATVPPPESR